MITNTQIETLSFALIYEGPLDAHHDRHIAELRALDDADYRNVINRTCAIFNAGIDYTDAPGHYIITPSDVEDLLPIDD
jgi:hypothetical protein